jgi:general control protein GCN4
LAGKYLSPSPAPTSTYSFATDAFNQDDLAAMMGQSGSTTFPSPALSGCETASSSHTNMATVSPQDLFAQNFSAPNSAALTALTSPSLYDGSPDFNNDFTFSPNNDGNLDPNGCNEWFPLFPDASQAPAPVSQDYPSLGHEAQDSAAPAADARRKSNDTSPTTSHGRHSSGSGVNAHRKSNDTSPTTSHGRHSSVSGVNARRREKPLPAIIVDDPADTVAMKRARNTLAARKSRERKAARVEELEETIKRLEEERDQWKELALSQQ